MHPVQGDDRGHARKHLDQLQNLRARRVTKQTMGGTKDIKWERRTHSNREHIVIEEKGLRG